MSGTISQTISSVSVTNGLFTTPIDFGASAFNGDARYLGIAVNCGSGLTPFNSRQALTPAPMALALPGLYTQQNSISPNVIGGYRGNTVTSGVYGATIGGGGESGATNRVTDHYGTVGGGFYNQAGDNAGSAEDEPYATVGGGVSNFAMGWGATVPGGAGNQANGDFSFAAGRDAVALNPGTFVWADSDGNQPAGTAFGSTAIDQFLIRAGGGVGIGTNSPGGQLHIASAGGFGAPQVTIAQTNSSDYARLRMTNGSASWDVAVGGISNTLTFYNGGNVLALNSNGNPLTTATGAYLTPGGAWTNNSNRNIKANFAP